MRLNHPVSLQLCCGLFVCLLVLNSVIHIMKQVLSNKLFSVWDAEMYGLTQYYEGLDIYFTTSNRATFEIRKFSLFFFFFKKGSFLGLKPGLYFSYFRFQRQHSCLFDSLFLYANGVYFSNR